MGSEAGNPAGTQVLEKGAVSVEDAKFSESSPARGRLDRLRERVGKTAGDITARVKDVVNKAPKDVAGSLKGDALELHVLNNALDKLGQNAAIGVGLDLPGVGGESTETAEVVASDISDLYLGKANEPSGAVPVIGRTETEISAYPDNAQAIESRPEELAREVIEKDSSVDKIGELANTSSQLESQRTGEDDESVSVDQTKEIEGRGGNKVEELIQNEFSDPTLWGKKRDAAAILGLEHPLVTRNLRDDKELVVSDPSKTWITNIYGMRIVPDEAATAPGAVKLEAVDLEMLPVIHKRLAETVLKGENIRIATPTTPPNAEGSVLDPENNNYWLQMIKDHKWPIYAEPDAPEGKPPYSSHDYADYHLVNFALFPREIQDLITEAATNDLEWRQLRQSGEVSTKMKLIDSENEDSQDPWGSGFRGNTSLTDGISKIDDLTDVDRYIPLLAYVVSNPDVSPEDRIADLLAYEKEPGIKKDRDPREHVVAGLNRMRAVVGDIVNFNTRYREDRNITQDEADAAFIDFLTGVGRVAHKIRGDEVLDEAA